MNFVNPLVGAVVEVLKTMGGIEMQRAQPFLKKQHGPTGSWDVSGIIAMNSDRFLGSMSISFCEDLLKKVYSNMFGSVPAKIDEEVSDAVAELTNIVFGLAKRDLNALGHTIAPAIPSVVSGRNHQIKHSVDGMTLCIPFESEAGKLLVECVISAKS